MLEYRFTDERNNNAIPDMLMEVNVYRQDGVKFLSGAGDEDMSYIPDPVPVGNMALMSKRGGRYVVANLMPRNIGDRTPMDFRTIKVGDRKVADKIVCEEFARWVMFDRPAGTFGVES